MSHRAHITGGSSPYKGEQIGVSVHPPENDCGFEPSSSSINAGEAHMMTRSSLVLSISALGMTIFAAVTLAGEPKLEWPFLRHYDQDHTGKIALPIGGIGTGKVSLGGRGDLRDWEIMNRPAKGYAPGLALTGFHYSAVDRSFEVVPKDGRFFWSTGYAYGTATQCQYGEKRMITIEPLKGERALQTVTLSGYATMRLKETTIVKTGRPLTVALYAGC
jgi:hypothetical protein